MATGNFIFTVQWYAYAYPSGVDKGRGAGGAEASPQNTRCLVWDHDSANMPWNF